MKVSRIVAAGASVLASVVLFTGCAGITHEPKVDMSALSPVDDETFFNALKTIGIDDSDIQSMVDTSFSFTDSDTEYEIVINLNATSEKNNQYSYTRCADEATAKKLFEYYYDNYDHVFDAKEFSFCCESSVKYVFAIFFIISFLSAISWNSRRSRCRHSRQLSWWHS